MNHTQQQFICSICGRRLVVDIFNYGVSHSNIQSVTCLECANKVGGHLINEPEEVNFEAVNPTQGRERE